MSAPRGCSVCRRPDAAEIDLKLGEGVQRTVLARQSGIGRESLRRHELNHLPGRVQAASKAHQEAPAADLIARLLEIHAETKAILREARDSKDHDSSLKAIARLERQLELEGKLLGIGELAPAGGDTLNVTVLDTETALRIANVFVRRHGGSRAALPPAPIDVTAEPVQEDA